MTGKQPWLLATVLVGISFAGAMARAAVPTPMLAAYGGHNETMIPIWVGADKGLFRKYGVDLRALRQRVGAALAGSPNQQTVSDIAGQLAGAQVALSNAKDRHDQTNTTLQNLLQSVEGAPTEQVAAQLLSLQTSLQATLQTTAMLLQTNILKYL